MWFWLFLVSASANIFFLFYVRWLLVFVRDMNEDIGSLNSLILTFTAHVKSIYELEMFYGDETLKALLEHGTELSSKLEDMDFLLDDDLSEEDQEEDFASDSSPKNQGVERQ